MFAPLPLFAHARQPVARPGPAQSAQGVTFTTISAGIYHSCGLTSGGAAYCWGYNDFGRLGDGTTSNRTSPVAVAGGLVFRAISAKSYGTCGITTDGATYCWGRNDFGQLGDGTTTNRSTPVAVLGP